ncbi:nuclear transport factor 2 family protein [Maribacter sp. PR1]|uniref:Nuclear transport factor 2 family protein n=1 Tax=Maribacter cobaltidurans TaxID=1178778 RepID=A0ABU7IPM3_9FLAO|nr:MULTISPECIES: nuclear transport factor 2 family protein [Maribacter]MDC6387432.1 nuclear transport factor 2 family protein [Maribacter sp. PR1]MEE1974819.1 nuclear transport factor 2 family protein [Maribacter cobaltidurans]
MNNKKSIKLPKPIRIVVLITLVSISCFLSLSAQSNDKNVAKIENSVTELYKAMVDKDKTILQDLTMDKLTYGHSSGTIENKAEYVDGVLNGAFQFTEITPMDQTISIVDKVGVVRHIFVAKGTNNGKPADVRIGCLLIFKKEGRWKLLARQAYKL